jgi:hypothetical protein
MLMNLLSKIKSMSMYLSTNVRQGCNIICLSLKKTYVKVLCKTKRRFTKIKNSLKIQPSTKFTLDVVNHLFTTSSIDTRGKFMLPSKLIAFISLVLQLPEVVVTLYTKSLAAAKLHLSSLKHIRIPYHLCS